MRHLNYADRLRLEILLKQKIRVAEISEVLGFSRVTIYKEIKLGTCECRDPGWIPYNCYSADKAQKYADYYATSHGPQLKIANRHDFAQFLCEKIVSFKFSPEAALAEAYKIFSDISISKTTLYRYIHDGLFLGVSDKNLPYRRRKSKQKVLVRRPSFYNALKRSIEERPKDVLRRTDFGHWEMDTVYGNGHERHCLLVLTERQTRYELIYKMKDRTAQSVKLQLDRLERTVPHFEKIFKSITCDNGSEFSQDLIEKSCRHDGTRTVTFFCHPFCSSERGSNERQNQLIRRWLPKGTDFACVSQKRVREVQDIINNYPRRMFDFASSADLFAKKVKINP